MSEPVQLVPSLTLLEDGGEFTLRVGEGAAELGRQVTSLLVKMGVAKKLLVITPTDTKVFKFAPVDGGKNIPSEKPQAVPAQPVAALRASQRISQDTAAPPAPELVGEYEEELRQQQAAEAEMHKMEALTRADPQIPQEEETVVEMPRKRGRPSKADQALKAATSCGRCQGQGALEGGGPCPVCKGKGAIVRYGRNG